MNLRSKYKGVTMVRDLCKCEDYNPLSPKLYLWGLGSIYWDRPNNLIVFEALNGMKLCTSIDRLYVEDIGGRVIHLVNEAYKVLGVNRDIKTIESSFKVIADFSIDILMTTLYCEVMETS